MDVHIVVGAVAGKKRGLVLVTPIDYRPGTTPKIDTLYISNPPILTERWKSLKVGAPVRTVIKEVVDGEVMVYTAHAWPVHNIDSIMTTNTAVLWPILSSKDIWDLPAPVQMKQALLTLVGKGLLKAESFSF